MSLNRVIRGSFWLYVSGITSNFLGYIYWLLASRFVPASTIGDAAAVIGVVSLITGLFSLGLSSGATRVFGQAYGRGDKKALSVSFTSSLVLNLAIYVAAALLVIPLAGLLSISRLDILYVTVLIIIGAFSPIPNALFNSTLRTKPIALSTIFSSTLRLIVGIALLYIGAGFMGVMLAFIIAGTVQDIVLFSMLRRIVTPSRPSALPAKESLKAGIPAWIPSLVSTAGTWLGVLGIYGITGAEQAGTYYIAFSISQIVYSLPLSLLGLMFPVLSGMEDGRKRAASRSIRLTSAIIAPLAAVVIAYPWVPLSMLGSSYVASSLALQLLLLGCFAAPISSGFNSLIYAYGKYRYVTALGLATNIPRVIFYPFLVALWGDSGAALSFISGLFIALAAVFIMARRIGYSVGWGASLMFAGIPSLLSMAMIFTGLYWVLGSAIILAASILAYARLGFVARADLAEISSAFLSRKQLDSAYPYVKYVLEVLYGK